jgi:hypothetical protein
LKHREDKQQATRAAACATFKNKKYSSLTYWFKQKKDREIVF